MSGHTGTEHEHDQHNPTSQDPKSGIAGAASDAAGKTLSFMTAKLPTKTSRIAAVAAAGTLVLAGAGSAYAVHSNDVSTHNKQVAAAQFAAEQKADADKAQADAAAKAAAERAAEQKAEADAAAKAAADKAAADKAAADKAAADKAAADKAAADKAAADKAAADKAAADQRAAAAAAANRDQQRQPLPSASSSTSAPAKKSTPTQKPTTPSGGSYGSAYAIAQSIVPSGQFACFANIIERESGWNVHATNPSSGAYGLGQALPGDKMASAGSDWENNPTTQIRWTLSYMDSRYGSPCGAWSFWQSHNWY